MKTTLKTICCLLAASFCFSFGHAQETKKGKPSGGFFWAEAGAGFYDLESLNAALGPEGYGSLNGTNVGIGGGGYIMIKGFMVGTSAIGFLKNDVSNSNNYAMLDSRQWQFLFGYTIFHSDRFLVYPRLGVGFFDQELLLREENAPGSFMDVAIDPGAGAILKREDFFLEPGIGLQVKVSGEGDGGLLLGLDVGYTLAPRSPNWTMWEREIAGGPDINPNGLIVRLSVGLGGWK